MFIKLIKVNGNNKKPIRSGEEITRFLSLIKLPLPGMAFSVPLCGEPASPWHWGWKVESVAGLAGNRQDRISLNNLSEAVSSYLSSKSGVCRGARKSSLLRESPWAHLFSRQVLNLGFLWDFPLPWLCSQTNLWGFEGNRAQPACPSLVTALLAGWRWRGARRTPPLGAPLQRCFLPWASLSA